MNFSNASLKIFIDSDFQKPNLYFRFDGKFTAEASQTSCLEWVRYLQQSTSPHLLVWDCTEMVGFEPAARTAWINALSNAKPHISKVYVISASIMIRSAAQLMLKMYGIPVTVAKTANEMKRK